MPTYEYLCENGHEFEELQSITAEPVAECPTCGAKARRQISAGVGLIFKGSGFYITDYKNKGKNGRAETSSGEGESKSGAETKSSSEAKSESTGEKSAKNESGKTSQAKNAAA